MAWNCSLPLRTALLCSVTLRRMSTPRFKYFRANLNELGWASTRRRHPSRALHARYATQKNLGPKGDHDAGAELLTSLPANHLQNIIEVSTVLIRPVVQHRVDAIRQIGDPRRQRDRFPAQADVTAAIPIFVVILGDFGGQPPCANV